jgi:hypothetical protein
LTATIPAGAATDSAGNPSTASTSTDNSVTFNSVGPTVTINQGGAQADPANASPIVFTALFSETVTGFDAADVTLSGPAAAGAVVTVSGGPSTYTVSVAVTAQGTLTSTFPAGAATDFAGNPSAAPTSTDNTVTFDSVGPTVTINQGATQADPANASPIVFTALFSEAVTGFDTADVTLSGPAATGAIATVSGGPSTYTVSVTATAQGALTVTIPAGAATDSAGNPSAASTSTDNSVTFDSTIPTVTINQGATQADPTNTSPIVFTAIFSETVTGFVAADVTLSGPAVAGAVVTISGGPSTYTVSVAVTAQGALTATIPAGAATNAAATTNSASTSTDNTVTFDSVGPTVTINQGATQTDQTNTSPIVFTALFSEAVTGFDAADVTLSGPAAAGAVATVSGGPSTYTVSVAVTAQGALMATSPAGAATDSIGNLSAASTSTDNSVTFDNTIPTVTINQGATQTDPTNASSIVFTALFSETVTGFTATDLLLSGPAATGAVATISGGPSTYTVSVAVTAQGALTVTIPAGAATDSAGNPSAASTSTDNTVTFDSVAPTVMIDQGSAQLDPTSLSPIVFTAIFSATVTGFETADVTLSGPAAMGAVAIISGGPSTYTVSVAVTAQGALTAAIPAGAATDSAGNPSGTSTSTDNTVTFSLPPADPAGLEQRKSDGITTIVVSGTTEESTVVFRTQIDEFESGLQFQVEIQSSGVPFTGIPSKSVLSIKRETDLTLSGLANGPYHWQARLVNNSGVAGNWVAFGGNGDPADGDFIILVPVTNGSPMSPTLLGQMRSGGIFPIPLGGMTDESIVLFQGALSDPDGGSVRLEIEVQPATSGFTGTPTATSSFVSNGSVATATASGSANGPFHWRARTADGSGAASGWISFGGNPDGETDFTVDTSTNLVPADPVNLSQHDTESGAPEAVGFLDDDQTLFFKATLSDPNPLQTVNLEVEVQPVATAFTGNPTAGGLADGSYHWQARAVDSAGAASNWVSFGGNPETAADFSILLGVNLPPGLPGSLGQFKGDGITSIGVGLSTNEMEVILRGTATDPEGNPCKIEVEVRPITTPFSGTPTAGSGSVPSGSAASLTLSGLANGSYHWRARAMDESGATSSWISFGGNGDGSADFTIDTTTNVAPSAGGLAQSITAVPYVLPQGGTTNEGKVTFKEGLDSGDPGQLVRARVEVRPVGISFTGMASGSSVWLPSGTVAEVPITGFADGVSYHWQAWAEDTNGAVSAPLAFGANSDPADPDFTKVVNTPPSLPTAQSQLLLNGVTVIPVGATTSQTGVIFTATASDPEGDDLQLQVELQPAGIPFANVPSGTGAAVASGSVARVTLASLANLLNYHWQFRVIDSSGVPSAWSSFGANGETEADFRVDISFLEVISAFLGGGGKKSFPHCGALGVDLLAPLGFLWLWRRRGKRRETAGR